MITKNGMIAVVPHDNAEKIGSIYIDPVKENSDYMNIIGTVVALPDTNRYYGRKAVEIRDRYPEPYDRPKHAQEDLAFCNNYGQNFESEIDVKVGDTVVFDWKQRQFSKDNYEGIFFMKYDALIAKLKGEEFEMLNGWLLVEPIKEKPKSEILDVSFAEEKMTMKAIVRHEGKIVTHYRTTPYKIDMDIPLKNKQILVRNKRMIKLEKFYVGYFKNPDYHLIQRKDILAYER